MRACSHPHDLANLPTYHAHDRDCVHDRGQLFGHVEVENVEGMSAGENERAVSVRHAAAAGAANAMESAHYEQHRASAFCGRAA